MPSLYVLDALNLVYRAYHALLQRVVKGPEEIDAEAAARPGRKPSPFRWEPLRSSKGDATNAIYGFANTVLKIRREEKPDYWALAWDGPGPTYRHQAFAEYKATRQPMPTDLVAQIPAVETMATALGLPIVALPAVEADDVMATLAHCAVRDGFDVVLVTGDKDLAQLVGDRVRLLSPLRRGDEYAWIDRAAVIEKWGVTPEQTRDVLALMGDSIDNIPGVPGVGPKSATELIQKFGTLDALYERLAEVKKPALREKLTTHRERAMLSRDLVTVRTDCDLTPNWESLRVSPIRRERLLDLAQRYELKRLEKIAMQEGVPEAAAGPVPMRRDGTSVIMETTAFGEPGAPSDPWAIDTDATRSDAAGAELAAPSAAFATPNVSRPPAPPRDDDAGRAADLFATPSRFEIAPEAEAVEAALADETATAQDQALAEVAVGEDTSQAERAADADAADRDLQAARDEAAERRAAAVSAAMAQARTASSQVALDLWAAPALATTTERGEARRQRLNEVRARAIHGLAVLPLGAGPDARRARLIGLALAAREGPAVYLPVGHDTGPNLTADELRAWLALALADPSVPKVGEDLKRDAHLLAGAGVRLRGLAFDLHIASFVCDPQREHDLVAMARDFLGADLSAWDEVVAGKASRRAGPGALDVDAVSEAAERAAAAMFPLADALRTQLEAREQWPLYESIDHPLVRVLVDMERTGVRVDPAVLDELSIQVARDITALEAELHALAGEPINLQSGPQLAKLMFHTFGLTPSRRTKTGWSTDQAVLEELADRHPFPAKLLEYRALTKLRSTYLDALPEAIDPADGRVHTTFNPVGAATGRLSSSAPNLQNIPIRTPLGRAIRRAFVAPPGRVLIGADYSQIELRLMAHLSGDPQLIEAFTTGEDVHATTARKIFGVTGELDPALRNRAKIVNFGVMYGMGARSLSQQMKIPLAEAQEFIKGYFRVFAGVREYLERQVGEARHRGYVQTLFGRRRFLPGLSSANGAERSFSERVAVNAPIQGSAADLMKLAMIRVHHSLKEVDPSARLLLQVHDELLVEADAEAADTVAERVCTEMEGAFALRVPLVVSVGHGASWFDVH